ncbi:MAG: hypothetical protein H6835_14145 [Planctomycetes bacterium]|nr:hypothetical protein [Planctomycetota bacterium]
MSKSILVILGLGAAGCVLLSLMMKQLVGLEADRARSPYLPVLENKFGARLVGPLRIDEQRVGEGEGARRRLTVRGRVLGGLDKQRMADAMGFEVWLGAMRAGDAPDELRVVLGDDDGGELLDVDVPRPNAARGARGMAPPTPPQGR